ncbi:MAG: hypothetical protein IJF94_03585 [Eubacterium sp.]|nr:hypothetical protein [Eubacterium sp.]
MKKRVIHEEIIYIVALFVVAFGVFLTARANFGVEMVVAPSYILSQKLGISFGDAERIVQAILFIAAIIIIRKFKAGYLFTAVTIYFYGQILRCFEFFLISDHPTNAFLKVFNPEPQQMVLRIILYTVGLLMIAFSIALFFRSYISPQSYELFVLVIAKKWNFAQNKVKYAFDISILIVAVIMAFALFGGLKNGNQWLMGVGTVIAAFVNAPLITIFGRIMDKFFEYKPIFPKAKKHFDY